MMAGTGVDMGDLKGLKGGVELSLHQDYKDGVGFKDGGVGEVGHGGVVVGIVGDCGEVAMRVNDRGVVTVMDKGGALHGVLVVQNGGGGVVGVGKAGCEVNGGSVDCNVEVKDGVGLIDGGVGEVEHGGVFVGIVGDCGEVAVEGNDHGVVTVMDKGGALHGLVVENGGGGVVGVGKADCEVNCGSVDCNVEVKDGVGLKDGGVGEVEYGGVVVGIGGDCGEVAVEGNDCGVTTAMDKGGALHGLVVENGGVAVVGSGQAECEVNVEDQGGLKDEGVVGAEIGEAIVGDGGNDCEVKVKDQVGLKDEGVVAVENGEVIVGNGGNDCEVKVENQVGLMDEGGVGVENGEVVVGARGSDQDYLVEENNHGLSAVTNKDVALHGKLFVETGSIGVVDDGQPAYAVKAEDQTDFESTTKPIDNQECPTNTVSDQGPEDDDRELGLVQGCKAKEVVQMTNDDGTMTNDTATLQTNLDEWIGGCADFVNGQNLGVVVKAKSFQFLVKLPRFDDDKLRQQIKDAQLLVDEKTRKRDNIRYEIEKKRAKLQSVNYKYEATKSDERAARRSVKLKRQEIDSIYGRINIVKNSISVIDITKRIAHMENMIEHETNPLKEEKQFLSEINRLRKLRDQISSNVCPEDEIYLPYNQIEPLEMQLKTLKRDLSDLKVKVSDVETTVKLLEKAYNVEINKLKELQALFRAADDVRQDAYQDFLSLKIQLHEKSKNFWMCKDEAKAANDYALSGDSEALYRLCINQVETFMDLWNKNDKFREDYVRCNMRSTLRRLKTSDGRSLGPDEEAPVIPVYVGEKEEKQLSTPSRTTYQSPATNMKKENTVKPVKSKQVDGKAQVVVEPKNKILKDKTYVKPTPGSGSVLHIVSDHLEDVEAKQEVKQQTEEELELARKAEMLREEEIGAKLKEKIRQEERAKAQEALERKRRNAEKAQMRAMLRVQKEAEQKEKERDKRHRKKDKKNTDGETGLDLPTESTKEERTDSPGTQPKKSSQVNKYSKPKPAPIPPALRNRGKRHYCKEIMLWVLAVLVLIFMFMVVNSSTNGRVKPVIKGDRFSGNHWQPI